MAYDSKKNLQVEPEKQFYSSFQLKHVLSKTILNQMLHFQNICFKLRLQFSLLDFW